jgi:hypothetical protein
MARSGRRSFNVHRFPTTEPDKFIEISVAYCEGGANYFSGQNNARAYYMHATPVTIEDRGNGVEIKTFMMFHGLKSRLEEVKRYSEKKILALVNQARQDCETRAPNVMTMVNRVAAEEKLTLQEAVAA